ncbi:MAG: hypothetical protein Aurels2KO_22830 [Aureliella sp.]
MAYMQTEASMGEAEMSSESVPAGLLVQTNAVAKAKIDRKLIYDAKISIEADDLDQFAKMLTREIELYDGFISNYSQRRYAGDRQTGEWVVRVASDKFQDILGWLDENYDVRSKKVTSQDVTEEFVDLTARLTNKKNTELRLSKVLDERSGKLEEVLSVEREIDRVREEIERIEGRLRYLNERTSLSTITLTVDTRVNYTPSKQQGFTSRISSAWTNSVSEMRRAAEGCVVALVGMAPWIPIWIAGLFVAYRIARFLLRRLLVALGSSPTPALQTTSQPSSDPPESN